MRSLKSGDGYLSRTGRLYSRVPDVEALFKIYLQWRIYLAMTLTQGAPSSTLRAALPTADRLTDTTSTTTVTLCVTLKAYWSRQVSKTRGGSAVRRLIPILPTDGCTAFYFRYTHFPECTSRQMLTVRISNTYPEWPLLRQTPGGKGVWGDCRFFINEDVAGGTIGWCMRGC